MQTNILRKIKLINIKKCMYFRGKNGIPAF